MRLAKVLMRAIGITGRVLPRRVVEQLARAVICRVAIFEVQIGEARHWQRVRVNPDEVQFA
jgi:hypothetical protein